MASGNPTLHSEFQRAERHLARAVAAEQTIEAVRQALDSTDHATGCDHWRGDGACSCLADRIRTALDERTSR